MALALACTVGMDGMAQSSPNGQPSSQSQQNPPAADSQSTSTSQSQSSPSNNSQSAQDVPDAPSTVQPPPPVTKIPEPPPDMNRPPDPRPAPSNDTPAQQPESTPPPATVQTIPPGTGPRNQIDPTKDLYTISIAVNFVQVPVTVNDSSGHRVDGLLAPDFSIYENGKKQTLSYFASDPFLLSVAIVLDTGLPDVALQEVNKTYSALAGSLSRWDEAALYTYSSSVSQVTDYNQGTARLAAALNEMKTVRGRNNGPAVLDGPLAENGPMINGLPVSGGPAPVNTPPREFHVLNDAILRAALDLGKRPDRQRRKVIFVISDGQELGSQASYRDVLRVLQSRNIEVKAVVVDMGALPGFRQLERLPRLKSQGYSDILPRYSHATGGGDVLKELTRNSIEEAYADITSEARNQYTLGYFAKPIAGSSAYRSVDVHVDRKGLKVIAEDGFYLTPSAR